jgi:hypothetical protein
MKDAERRMCAARDKPVADENMDKLFSERESAIPPRVHERNIYIVVLH